MSNKTDILIEPKLITHLSEREVGEDVHIVRERIHDIKNNTKEDNIRIVKNYKRPFWITKPVFRNYKDKKESEDLDKVDMFKSTESRLGENIAPRLGNRYVGIKDLNILRSSPYLYGIDVDSRTFLKYQYMKKYNANSPYRVAAFDIEVDVLTNKIIVASLAGNGKLYTYYLTDLVKGIYDHKEKLKRLYDKYIPEHNLGEIEVEYQVFNDEIKLLKAIFKRANELGVDFVAIWNMNYDIPTILDKLEERRVDPVEIFHYDKIPKKYAYFKYRPGKTQKVTESGRVIPINPEEQWHTVKSTTNYYFIDAMSSYRYVRVGGKTVSGGFSLDNILEKEGVAKKLKFDESGGIKGVEWHIHMVEKRPLHYIIYNQWDVLSMLVLDKKTKDLEVSVPLLSGISHFDIFNSGPKKIIDALEFFYLDKKKVLGVKPRQVDEDKLLDLSGWIVTLPSYRIDENGLFVIEGNNVIRSSIRGFVFDADAVSSYPNNTRAANVSKDTTHRELLAIQGMDKEFFKVQNIDLIYGPTNAVEWCTNMLNFPDMFKVHEEIVNKK